MAGKKRHIVLVTGLSGAGLSTALGALEDMGWKAVDNLPLSLIDNLLDLKSAKDKSIAIGIDSRTWDFDSARLIKCVNDLRTREGVEIRFLFIDCLDQTLLQRFTETRRRHPLASDRPVLDGILQERARMETVKDAANLVIDTTDMSPHDLRRAMAGHFSLEKGHGLLTYVMSFSYKHGLPREADMVFDARFLNNPHWDVELRPLTGLDGAVGRKITQDASYFAFFKNLTTLIAPLLKRFAREGKSYLTIAVGCSGGKHRSVFVAEELFKWLDSQGQSVAIRHRELEKQGLTAKQRRKKKAS